MSEDLDVKALESELVTLAGHLAAGTCRMLQLLAGWTITPAWDGERLDPNPILHRLVPELRASGRRARRSAA